MPILLSDEEIEQLEEDCVDCHGHNEKDVARTQLKKDAEYLAKYVFSVDTRGYIALKPNATKNYQAFMEEAGLTQGGRYAELRTVSYFDGREAEYYINGKPVSLEVFKATIVRLIEQQL